ncbi:MAG: metallophosphoesterase [Methanoregula sp.]|nr:metallophosphoesterase [Methanoregula sp.]
MPFKDPVKKAASQKKYDAGRLTQQSAKGQHWQKLHPEAANENLKTRRKRYGHKQEGIFAEMIDEQRNPLLFESDNVAVTGDWHIPFMNWIAYDQLIQAKDEHGVKDLVVGGDFWDCDNYSKFARISNVLPFEGEIEEVQKILKMLLPEFDRIFFCRGNHEKRWMDLNGGMMGMRELFRTAIPENISEERFSQKVHITQDDHIHLIQKGQLWLLCHPKNFRQVNLSVVRDLCAKHACNVVGFHGHQYAQGWDRSGLFRIADGGGLFHRESLDYLRETTCHPMTRNGFYIIQDNALIPFEPGPTQQSFPKVTA